MNKISKEYISKTKALFPTWGKSEKKYLQNLQLIIEDYCKEKNIYSLNALYPEFGIPDEVVNSYYSTLDNKLIIKQIKHTTFIQYIISVIVSIIFLTSITCTLYQKHKCKE